MTNSVFRVFSYVIFLSFALCFSVTAIAATKDEQASDFSLQVSPSPVVATIKPGEQDVIELKIRNAGSGKEKLKIEPRNFTFNSKTQQLKLDENIAKDVASFTKFSDETFEINPGESFTEKVTVSLPEQSGFSYSFALIISRQDNNQKTDEKGRLLNGSVAVFCLINVDKPGATKSIKIDSFEASQKVYEYLPAKFEVTFTNDGNTVMQPYGNIFIQRGNTDEQPISTLPVNNNNSYILPGTNRILSAEWSQGFPVNKKTVQSDGSSKESLVWDWSTAKISDIRFGQYTAKLVAVYNDGERDIPVVGEVTFWVIPWKIILLITIVMLFIGWRIYVRRKTYKQAKKIIKNAQEGKTK